jgi:integrating conjugative element protein (TIGR03761 family)
MVTRKTKPTTTVGEAPAADVRFDEVQTEAVTAKPPVVDPTGTFANPEVPPEQAQKINSLSALITGQEDVMTLHTQEAARLFNGVSPPPDSGRYWVPGARRAANDLRTLFVMSARDNPYADQALRQADLEAQKIAADMQALENAETAKLDARAKRGVSWSILQAAKPQQINLGYKSPYGFMLTNLLADFDYLVRLLKTSERRDLRTNADTYRDLALIKRQFRTMFFKAIKSSTQLLQPTLVGICRSDYLPTATPVAVKRVQAAVAALGDVDKAILLCEVEPRHSLRRYRMTAQEREVLRGLLTQPVPADESPAAADDSNLVA